MELLKALHVASTSWFGALAVVIAGGSCSDEPKNEDRYVADECEVVGSSECSPGCQRIVSSYEPSMPCAKPGVFFGCAPDEDSSFWDDGWNSWEGLCDIAAADAPNFVYYCLRGRGALHWYMRHSELFCSHPDAQCTGEVVDDCVGE